MSRGSARQHTASGGPNGGPCPAAAFSGQWPPLRLQPSAGRRSTDRWPSRRSRRRFIATTDSDHDGPIFPNLAKDITYVALPARFICVAIILDIWSRFIAVELELVSDREHRFDDRSVVGGLSGWS